MTEKEKAIQLVAKFSDFTIGHAEDISAAKKCALIAVKEMQELYSDIASAFLGDKKDGLHESKYLTEVEQEIKKL